MVDQLIIFFGRVVRELMIDEACFHICVLTKDMNFEGKHSGWKISSVLETFRGVKVSQKRDTGWTLD